MVKVWTRQELVNLGLGLIDCISGGDGQNPKITSIAVEYSAIHLSALREVAKALREKAPLSTTATAYSQSVSDG